MPENHKFISHATADDDFVAELHQELERLGLEVWVDSRNLRGGSKLEAEIEAAITAVRQVIVVPVETQSIPIGSKKKLTMRWRLSKNDRMTAIASYRCCCRV
jgi:hypothetical protein